MASQGGRGSAGRCRLQKTRFQHWVECGWRRAGRWLLRAAGGCWHHSHGPSESPLQSKWQNVREGKSTYMSMCGEGVFKVITKKNYLKKNKVVLKSQPRKLQPSLSLGFIFHAKPFASNLERRRSTTPANHTHRRWSEHFLDSCQHYFLSRTIDHFLLSKKPCIRGEKTTVHKNTSSGTEEKSKSLRQSVWWLKRDSQFRHRCCKFPFWGRIKFYPIRLYIARHTEHNLRGCLDSILND